MSYYRGPPYSPSGYYSPGPPQFSEPRAGPPYLTHTSQHYPHQSPGSPASYISSSPYPSPSYTQNGAYAHEFQHVRGNRVQHRSSILPSQLRADNIQPLMNVGNNATQATVFGRNVHLYDENTTFHLSEGEYLTGQKPRRVKECEDLVFENQGMRRPSIQRHFEGVQSMTLVGGTFTVGARRVDYIGPEADRAEPGERYGRAQREIDEAAKEVERRLETSRSRHAQRVQRSQISIQEAPPHRGQARAGASSSSQGLGRRR